MSIHPRGTRRIALCSLALAAVSTALMWPWRASSTTESPPAEDAGLTVAAQDPGTSTDAPLVLPHASKAWGVNGATCVALTDPQASVREDRSFNRGLGCREEGELLAGIGARAVRLPVDWYRLEYERDRWDEASWDRLLANVEALDVKVLAIISCTPWWASVAEAYRRPGNNTCRHAPWDTPEIDEEAGEFAAEVVRRLGDRLLAIEVYNEPNYKRYWQPGPDPARYGRLFTAVSRAAHDVDPQATVLFGGGALNVARNDANGLTIESFFKRAISLGGARPRAQDLDAGWDGVSAHIYPPQNTYKVHAPVDGTQSYVGGTVKEVRRGIRWIDLNSPIWWTETGVSNSGYQVSASDPSLKIGPGRDWQHPDLAPLTPCGSTTHGACDIYRQQAVSQEVAADALEDMLRYLFSVGDTGGVFVHELLDRGSGWVGGAHEGLSEMTTEGRLGLVETPGGEGAIRPKLAYCRLQELAGQEAHPECPG